MPLNIGINGFGRIGKVTFLEAIENPCFNVVAINARRTPEEIVKILKYDTNYGKFKHMLGFDSSNIYVDGRPISIFSKDSPDDIPWHEVSTHTVLECTGKFLEREACLKHIEAGAKKVIISAPAKSDDIPTFVYGVNSDKYTSDMDIVSGASCTTNCLAPIVKVLNDNFGIKYGGMITVHAMTGSQFVVDSFSRKDIRSGRAAGCNLIPATTGASKAIKKVIPELKGKLSGTSVRVPTLTGSYVYLMCALEKSTPFNTVCDTLKLAAENDLKGVLNCTNYEIVSSDIIGENYASIFDEEISKKAMKDLSDDVAQNFIGIGTWYDNEWGYVSQMLKLALHMNGYSKEVINGEFRYG